MLSWLFDLSHLGIEIPGGIQHLDAKRMGSMETIFWQILYAQRLMVGELQRNKYMWDQRKPFLGRSSMRHPIFPSTVICTHDLIVRKLVE
jgi:hypothetical protein